MGSRHRTRVKICCIQSVREARMAIDAGADAVGLVAEMPSGPGVIDESTIAEIAAVVPPGVTSVLLTSHQKTEQIIAQQRRCAVSAIQICDELLDGRHDDVRRACPGVSIVQVIHVTGPESVAQAQQAAQHVDAILLDSGRPCGERKELGGTGRRHDWRVSRQVRDCVAVPVYLAGGLNPGNAFDAVRSVQPFALDVCSGLRVDGRLDGDLLWQFMAEVRRAG